MKKSFVAIAIIASSFAANALDPFIEFAPVIVGDNSASFNFQGGITQEVYPSIQVGAGIGITQCWDFEYAPMIPIFARGQVEKTFGEITPYLSFDLGYEINTDNIEYGAILVNPMIGVKFGKFYGGMGYLGHCYTTSSAGTANNFVLRLGMTF